MIEFLLVCMTVFSWSIFLKIMYPASMMIAWWCYGHSGEKVSSDDFGMILIFTAIAPLICIIYLLIWCYENGQNYNSIVSERRERRLERRGESGMSEEQIERLGVND